MNADARPAVIDATGFQRLIDLLSAEGFDVYGPQLVDAAIVVRPLVAFDQLPVAVTVETAPGHVAIGSGDGAARFAWAPGGEGWKALVHPPDQRVATTGVPAATTTPVIVRTPGRPARRRALVGVRPCDAAAIAVLDRVLVERPTAADAAYAARRRDLFVVVVNCSMPAATCFCASMGTGPHLPAERRAVADLVATELTDETVIRLGSDDVLEQLDDAATRPATGGTDGSSVGPRYVVEARSAAGTRLLGHLAATGSTRLGTVAESDAVARQRTAATAMQGRAVDPEVAAGIAQRALALRWDDVDARCLACANCTAVCPTCFCTDVHLTLDPSAGEIVTTTTWDSCFALEFSRVGAVPVRSSVGARYRQWLTHKFSTWRDQFGETGCVGCGRCIAWCPVGIDVTEEVAAVARAAPVSTMVTGGP